MKTLSANFLCCDYKLYRIGVLIGLIYLIPHFFFFALNCVLGTIFSNFSTSFICAFTVLTSLFMIKGLIEEKHDLLLPWLANSGVFIVSNIIYLINLFEEINRKETKELFYLQFVFFIVLEFQILFWYVICCLWKRGYKNSKTLTGPAIKSISKVVETEKSDHYKIDLFVNDNLIAEKKTVTV